MVMVVHFFTLEEFTDELLETCGKGTVVRVEHLMRYVPLESTPGMHDSIAEVHVRAAVTDSLVHVFMLPVGRVRMLYDHPFSVEPDAPDRLRERLQEMEREVAAYLVGRGLHVARGLIDIGEAKAVSGTWSGRVGGDGADG